MTGEKARARPRQTTTEVPKRPKGVEHWINGLLMTAVGVAMVQAVLLIQRAGPSWLPWVLLGTMGGLVALGCVVGVGEAVWRTAKPLLARRRQRRHTENLWSARWEGLMEKPVQ